MEFVHIAVVGRQDIRSRFCVWFCQTRCTHLIANFVAIAVNFRWHLSRQALPLPRWVLLFAASLIWLPNVLSAFGGALLCFGFLFSRLLRCCPLAIAKCPFHEGRAASRQRIADRLQTVLRGHPFMTFVVTANTVLWGTTARRKSAGDVVDVRRQSRSSKPAPQTNRLTHLEEMRCSVAPCCAGIGSQNACIGHDCSWSFSRAPLGQSVTAELGLYLFAVFDPGEERTRFPMCDARRGR